MVLKDVETGRSVVTNLDQLIKVRNSIIPIYLSLLCLVGGYQINPQKRPMKSLPTVAQMTWH